MTLMRLPHTRHEVWGPPSWQYGYQQRTAVEFYTMRVFESLAPQCGTTSSLPPLVLEVGANEGAYGRVASAMGCRVISVEPQPACMRLLAYAVAMVPTRRTACLVHALVSDKPLAISMASAPCSGVGHMTHNGTAEGATFNAGLQGSQPDAERQARMQPEVGFLTQARDAVVQSSSSHNAHACPLRSTLSAR